MGLKARAPAPKAPDHVLAEIRRDLERQVEVLVRLDARVQLYDRCPVCKCKIRICVEGLLGQRGGGGSSRGRRWV